MSARKRQRENKLGRPVEAMGTGDLQLEAAKLSDLIRGAQSRVDSDPDIAIRLRLDKTTAEDRWRLTRLNEMRARRAAIVAELAEREETNTEEQRAAVDARRDDRLLHDEMIRERARRAAAEG